MQNISIVLLLIVELILIINVFRGIGKNMFWTSFIALILLTTVLGIQSYNVYRTIQLAQNDDDENGNGKNKKLDAAMAWHGLSGDNVSGLGWAL